MMLHLGQQIDYECLLKLMNIKFDSRQMPKDIKEKFEFQLGFNSWNKYDKDRGRLEWHLLKHAEYILKNAPAMIKDPAQRGLL